ncbi:hypothetical protein TCAL_09386, partial [Tigriopus californicus]|eukprot:TCALIF_09386-PA protein Name:"Protein of unknown function" AED:0.21 eAED:0.28 QI:44/0/0/1/0/0/3/0/191
MTRLRTELNIDPESQALKQIIVNGFPDSKSELPEIPQPFWCVREHLRLIDDLILNGERLFQVTSVDLFEHCGFQYMDYVDRLSGWPCMDRLGKTANPSDMTCLRTELNIDPESQALKQIIVNGFPDSKSELPESLQPFWCVREHLRLIDDLIFNGERLVIPRNLRKGVLHDLHASHIRQERTKTRARHTVY